MTSNYQRDKLLKAQSHILVFSYGIIGMGQMITFCVSHTHQGFLSGPQTSKKALKLSLEIAKTPINATSDAIWCF